MWEGDAGDESMTALNKRSKQVRRDTLTLSKANGGYHFGGSFSCVEILIALYDHVLKPEDKFILSKGHACWPYYVLLREKGLNPKLGGHPTLDDLNGVHFTTGSEGHGLPAAIGMALARKIQGKPGRIFVLMGDGECQEGTTWEGLLTAAHHKLDNLTVIVDWNLFQGAGAVKDNLPVNGIGAVANIFGWTAIEVNGHDAYKIELILKCKRTPKPLLIIAKTLKGKGVSFMEGKGEWHAKFPNPDQEAQIYKELE